MDWMKFKGVRSDKMHVRLTKYPKIVRAEERVTEHIIPGRSEPLFILEGDGPAYRGITITPELVLLEKASFVDVRTWLSGGGDLSFSDDPDYCYHARVIDEVEYEQIVRGRRLRSVAPRFRCAPFRYRVNPETLIKTAPFQVTNPGSVGADPLWEVAGSGDINLLVGNKAVLLSGINGSILIDCDAKIAYQGSRLLTGLVSLPDGWPSLPVGQTAVSWMGAVAQVKLTPRWRWL